jgi:hypothetical protein
MQNVDALEMRISIRKFILRVVASWIVMMALDLLLNAGLFAKLWLEPSSFLLGPRDLFRRLPLGYAAFLLQALAYVWLANRMGVRNWRQGTLFGLKLGVILSIAAVLGLRSGTTASWTMLLVAWLIGGTVLTTGACLMAGFSSDRGEKKALVSAFLILIGAVILIAVLQSTGLVPVRRMN